MPQTRLVEEARTHSLIGAFFDVYNALGYGFLESVYAAALESELAARGHSVRRELLVAVSYKGNEVAKQRIDMLVDGKVVVECKSTRELHRSAARQVYNYLRATDLEVGLLFHFGPEPAFYRLFWRGKTRNQPTASDG